MDPPILAPGGVIVKPSPIGGNGLFTSRDFKKVENVTE
jgi:hypothetical protein